MFQNNDGRICCARARLLGPSEEFSAAACQALEEVQPFSGHSRPFHRPHHRQGCVTRFATASVRGALAAAGGSGLEGLGALELAGQTAAGGILGRTAVVPGRAGGQPWWHRAPSRPTDDQGLFSLIWKIERGILVAERPSSGLQSGTQGGRMRRPRLCLTTTSCYTNGFRAACVSCILGGLTGGWPTDEQAALGRSGGHSVGGRIPRLVCVSAAICLTERENSPTVLATLFPSHAPFAPPTAKSKKRSASREKEPSAARQKGPVCASPCRGHLPAPARVTLTVSGRQGEAIWRADHLVRPGGPFRSLSCETASGPKVIFAFMHTEGHCFAACE